MCLFLLVPPFLLPNCYFSAAVVTLSYIPIPECVWRLAYVCDWQFHCAARAYNYGGTILGGTCRGE